MTRLTRVVSTPLRDAALQSFEQDRAEDDRAGRKSLPEDLDPGEVEEIPSQRDDDHADDGAQNFALAAIKAGAADHDGGDDFELKALAGVRRHRSQTRYADDPGERRHECDDHQALDL